MYSGDLFIQRVLNSAGQQLNTVVYRCNSMKFRDLNGFDNSVLFGESDGVQVEYFAMFRSSTIDFLSTYQWSSS